MFDIGLVPCTATKNPQGVTPLTLYKGGPFSLMVRHARQRCKRIVIMSAKYGLLEENARVQYYDTFIGDLDAGARQELMVRVRSQLKDMQGQTALSYLWKPYYSVLQIANVWDIPVATPYMGLPSLVLYKVLSNEIKDPNPTRRRLVVE